MTWKIYVLSVCWNDDNSSHVITLDNSACFSFCSMRWKIKNQQEAKIQQKPPHPMWLSECRRIYSWRGKTLIKNSLWEIAVSVLVNLSLMLGCFQHKKSISLFFSFYGKSHRNEEFSFFSLFSIQNIPIFPNILLKHRSFHL